jgi:cupin fold WbuC family metalloprotein
MPPLKPFSPVTWAGGLFSSCHLADLNTTLRAHDIARVCFHASESSDMHVMTIGLGPNVAYPIHRHIDTDEWYLVLTGQLNVSKFDGDLNLYQNFMLTSLGTQDTQSSYGLMVEKTIWHSTTSGPTGCIFLEVRKGPFVKEKTIYAINTP